MNEDFRITGTLSSLSLFIAKPHRFDRILL